MQIELSEQQYRYLLDLVYVGNWIMNSTREPGDRIQEYDLVQSEVFSHCHEHKMNSLAESVHGVYRPSHAFEKGGIHEAIGNYEDFIFFEILAEELALRDMNGQPMNRENYDAMLRRIDQYLAEFHTNGMENITVDLNDNGRE